MTQDKTISRDEFIYGLQACGFTVKNGQTYYDEQELIKCFDDLYFNKGGEKLPPITPDRPTGHWIDVSPITWKCNQCGYGVGRWNNTNFCPNCGVRMVGDNDESNS